MKLTNILSAENRKKLGNYLLNVIDNVLKHGEYAMRLAELIWRLIQKEKLTPKELVSLFIALLKLFRTDPQLRNKFDYTKEEKNKLYQISGNDKEIEKTAKSLAIKFTDDYQINKGMMNHDALIWGKLNFGDKKGLLEYANTDISIASKSYRDLTFEEKAVIGNALKNINRQIAQQKPKVFINKPTQQIPKQNKFVGRPIQRPVQRKALLN